SIKFLEISFGKCSRNLDGAVWPKIIKYNRVPIFNFADGIVIIICHNGRYHKLIKDILFIGALDNIRRIIRFWTFSIYDGVIYFLLPVPAIITIHVILTTTDAC